MPRRLTVLFELLLLFVALTSLGLGVDWSRGATVRAIAAPPANPKEQPAAQATSLPTSTDVAAVPSAVEAPDAAPTATPIQPTEVVPGTATAVLEITPEPLGASSAFSGTVPLDAGDAPLLVQAPGTINILLLGTDATANQNLARTDTILVASINPDMPSVSLLSFPRDLQVRIPNHADDRINIAFEQGYLQKYTGGGPAFLAVVLRKNFGIKIDHFMRIDFAGFVKAVDQLGGVQVLAECELHDTFPNPAAPGGKTDLDVYPSKVELNGFQALMFARSRWSTTDFDRARRQQKVLRGLFSKVKGSNVLQNAIGLYSDFQENLQTDLGLANIPAFVDIARRLDDLAIQNRVITYPIVKNLVRPDGAMVLLPTPDILAYIADALSPPAGNRSQIRPRVEVYNASNRPDMELVAAERLGWEGFLVVGVDKADIPEQAKTQIFDFTTTPKGSPIARLASIFSVTGSNIIQQPDPSSVAQARVVLGDNYNSCPSSATIAGDVTLDPGTADLIPTSTPSR